MARTWYVVRTQAGYEAKVGRALRQRARQHGLEGAIGEMVVPTEEVIEAAPEGAPRARQRVAMPGYLFVQMELSEPLLRLLRGTPRLLGLVGEMSAGDVQRALAERKPRPAVSFEVGERVRVAHGPFASLGGTVTEVEPDKRKLRVILPLFGRPTPVELDFGVVSKE